MILIPALTLCPYSLTPALTHPDPNFALVLILALILALILVLMPWSWP